MGRVEPKQCGIRLPDGRLATILFQLPDLQGGTEPPAWDPVGENFHRAAASGHHLRPTIRLAREISSLLSGIPTVCEYRSARGGDR